MVRVLVTGAAGFYADVDALIKDVDFKPNTPIKIGIERFVKWCRSYCQV